MRKLLLLLCIAVVYGHAFAQPFYPGFSTYTPDGLFSPNATPIRFITPNSNGETRIGYIDYGGGQYSPRIGFWQNSAGMTAASNSLGNVSDGSLTVNVGANNNERIRILPSGFVGIGISTPESMLHVNGSTTTNILSLAQGATHLGYLGRGGAITGGWSQSPEILSLNYLGRDFAIGGWSKSNTTWMGAALYINSDNNNIGIGTTTPGAKLSIGGSAENDYNNASLRINNTWSMNGNFFVSSFVNTSTSDNNLRIGENNEVFLTMIGDSPGGGLTRGHIGIGTTQPDSKLTVRGKIHAEEVKVDLSVPGPDYVFNSDYNLTSLPEIEKFISLNKHLPEIPSAKEMEKDGIRIGEMQMKLLQKIEELTLHLIEKEKELQAERSINKKQETALESLSERLDVLEKKNK